MREQPNLFQLRRCCGNALPDICERTEIGLRSTAVSGVGFGVSPKRSFSARSPRKRDAFAHARDGRAPQNSSQLELHLVFLAERPRVDSAFPKISGEF